VEWREFRDAVLAYRRAMELAAGTEIARYCYARLSGLYGYRVSPWLTGDGPARSVESNPVKVRIEAPG